MFAIASLTGRHAAVWTGPVDADVLIENTDGVAEIVLNRPARRNALTETSLARLSAVLSGALADADTRVLLLRGAGGCFCSGLDLAEAFADADWSRRWSRDWAALHRRLAEADTPIVVALERAAVNAGAALALSADLLVTGDAAFLQVGEVRRDMVPWANIAWLCARFGAARALDLTVTGRRVTGAELYRLGMAHTCAADAEVLSSARDLARTLASHPPGGMAATKRLIRETCPDIVPDPRGGGPNP